MTVLDGVKLSGELSSKSSYVLELLERALPELAHVDISCGVLRGLCWRKVNGVDVGRTQGWDVDNPRTCAPSTHWQCAYGALWPMS